MSLNGGHVYLSIGSAPLKISRCCLVSLLLHIPGQLAEVGIRGHFSLPSMTAVVTLVTVHAVVHISLHPMVVPVCLRLCVTVGALENRVIIRVRMARRAHAVGVAMVDRELRVLRVVERRVQPVRSAVAVLARRWEELRLRGVPRIGRTVVIRLVTANARRWQSLVVVVDVAVDARPRRHGV